MDIGTSSGIPDAKYITIAGLVQQYSPTGEEQKAVTWFIQRMQQLGFSKAFKDQAGNAVGIMGDGPRQIVLLGHIDTVPGQIPVGIQDHILYGRGSVDAKGPLAAFADAISKIGVLSGWQLVVIGAVDEEGASTRGALYCGPIPTSIRHYRRAKPVATDHARVQRLRPSDHQRPAPASSHGWECPHRLRKINPNLASHPGLVKPV